MLKKKELKLHTMGYCSLHFEKHGEPSGGNLGNHIDRVKGKEYSYRHADLSLTKNNKALKADYNKYCALPYNDAIRARIEDGYKGTKAIRKDATYSVNTILSGSHEELKEIEKDPKKLNAWITANLRWCEANFGKENIVRFSVHLDEKTPHIHCVWVPITAKGGLSAKEYIGDGKKLEALQTSYANAMKPFGLERGIPSDRKHQTTDEYRRRENEKLRTAKQITDKIENITRLEAATNLGNIKKDLTAAVNGLVLRQEEKKAQEMAELRGRVVSLSQEKEQLQMKLNKQQKPSTQPKYIAPDKVQQIVEGVNVIDYFLHLAKRGVLNFEKKSGKEFIFTDQAGAQKVSVSDKGWRDFKSDEGGQIVKAVMKYEKLDWLGAVNWLNEFQGGISTEFAEIRKKTAESKPNMGETTYAITQVVPPSSPPLLQYFEQRGISASTLKMCAKQVHYQLGDKHYYGIGIQNDKGNWEVRNPFMKTKLGEQWLTEKAINKEAKKVFVLEGMTDFFSMVEILRNNKRDLKEYKFVILNSVTNALQFFERYRDKKDHEIMLCLDGDQAGETTTYKLLKALPHAKDIRANFGIGEKGYKDLNESLKTQLQRHQEQEEKQQRKGRKI